MKKVLLTWYGITDLKASFHPDLGGPILGALKTNDYTDALILGYTNSQKDNIKKDILEELQQDKNLIFKYANTDFAHKHFYSWLTKKLKNESINTKISFRKTGLSELNDTEGIYNNAIKALKNILSLEEDCEIWLYISPGTPVMAFVWAFVSLRFPKAKIYLLASSKPNLPPEKVNLPKEWLEWHGKQLVDDENRDKFDVIFHLLGEQKMPSLLGIRQFECKKHVFINTSKYPAGSLKNFIEDDNLLEIHTDPYDPEDVRVKILNVITENYEHSYIGFNLTGGTKLMYAGALAACRKVNATPFYFDKVNNEVIYLNNFKRREPIADLNNVETFIKLNASHVNITNPGKNFSNDRIEMSKLLWANRKSLSKLYRKISDFIDSPGMPFSYSYNQIKVELTADKKGRIIVEGKKPLEIPDCPGFARYLLGGWFEEYTFYRLQEFVDKGIIKDLRINFKVSYAIENRQNEYQELDVVFTDGDKLYIIECKSGTQMKSTFVSKLESITRAYGGITAIGILACCFETENEVFLKKAAMSPNIRLFAGGKIFDEFHSLLKHLKMKYN